MMPRSVPVAAAVQNQNYNGNHRQQNANRQLFPAPIQPQFVQPMPVMPPMPQQAMHYGPPPVQGFALISNGVLMHPGFFGQQPMLPQQLPPTAQQVPMPQQLGFQHVQNVPTINYMRPLAQHPNNNGNFRGPRPNYNRSESQGSGGGFVPSQVTRRTPRQAAPNNQPQQTQRNQRPNNNVQAAEAARPAPTTRPAVRQNKPKSKLAINFSAE
jgi:hypothetical protein